ncbi:hypothetical protein I4O85_005010 [Clostridioides difficile]
MEIRCKCRKSGFRTDLKGASSVAEDVMIARVYVGTKTGAKVDIQHISSGVSVDMVRFAKYLGASS